ncbi:MAG: class I SAM-dependent methyltransferase [Smithella sp.]|jgi:ubiquinone/menaquinone biosynthesis C-methylase UbiE
MKVGQIMLSAGEVLKKLPVALLRPEDMILWARVRYDRSSKSWNEINNPDMGLTDDEMEIWKQMMLHRSEDHKDEVSSNRMLILGGGGGREAIFFVRAGWQVTILDISEGMLAEATVAADARHLTIQTVQGDLAMFDAPKHTYDAVWTSMFLYSLVLGRDRRIAMLRRVRHSLVADGCLVVSFHFDPQAQYSARIDRLCRLVALLTAGNIGYQNGDILFGTLEFRHVFASEAELRAEFAESGLTVADLRIFYEGRRGAALLVKTSRGDIH